MPRHENELKQPVGAPVPEWSPPPRPAGEPLQGRSCRLERLDPARHAEPLFAALRADAAGAGWTYLPYGPFTTLAAYREWMDRSCTGDDPLFYVVLEAATEAPVGVASYLRIDPANGSIE